MTTDFDNFRRFIAVAGVLTFVWWPLSHWLFPDAYHRWMGFTTYDKPMARIIGTCGLMFCAVVFLIAWRPWDHAHLLMITSAFLVLLAATYGFLIARGEFPGRELLNVAFCLGGAVANVLLYPWSLT